MSGDSAAMASREGLVTVPMTSVFSEIPSRSMPSSVMPASSPPDRSQRSPMDLETATTVSVSEFSAAADSVAASAAVSCACADSSAAAGSCAGAC